MEDYKAKYEKAIEQAKKELQACGSLDCDAARQIFRFFPELKESEDERIRKELIHFFKNHMDSVYEEISDNNAIIAWLENQSSISPTEDELEALRIAAYEPTKNWSEKLQSLYEKLVYCRQKPTDKVEPKFKVGDWVVIQESTYQITKAENLNVTLSLNGRECIFDIDVLKNAHLWSIEDAKEGDVLADGYLPFIFKRRDSMQRTYAYCGVSADGDFKVKSDGELGEWTWMQDLTPATKEQRDLLFQKMKESGYEWDAKNKKLKQIEQKASIDFSDLKTWKYIVDAVLTKEHGVGQYLDDGRTEIMAKELQERFGNISQNPAWSEEDENFYTRCESAIQTRYNDGLFTMNEYKQTSLWLKSLKDRVQPQPRQKQSGDVVSVIERGGEQWVRVCALGEDFIIAAHDYRDGDKAEFTWEEACEIGTFTIRQAYIILALKDEINARLREIGGEPLSSYYWSSSEWNNDYAYCFSSSTVVTYDKSYNNAERRVIAF